jgi:hypothetical protein
MLCLCGCGEEAKKGNKFIWGHNGRVMSDESIEKRKESLRKVWAREGFKEKWRKQIKEMWKDPLFRKKQKDGMNRPEVIEKVRKQARENMQNPETKAKMIRTMKRKFSDPDFRKMISERTKQGMKEKGYTSEVISELTKEGMKDLDLSGPNSASWRGGLSYKGYCPTWNDQEVKEYILERDNHQCQNPYCWGTTDRIARHHIDYDKENCVPENIITLCFSCNGRANKNRKYWRRLYRRMINEKSHNFPTH